MTEGLRRLDDQRIDSMKCELTDIKKDISELKDNQTQLFQSISSNNGNIQYLKERLEEMEQQFSSIHQLLQQINGNKDRTIAEIDGKLGSLKESVANLARDQNNIHEWAAKRMAHEEKVQNLKEKIYASILTRAATAIILFTIALIGLGFYTYVWDNLW